jgi:ABC-type transport system involved in multi-copper enzyme maturation permease subunit
MFFTLLCKEITSHVLSLRFAITFLLTVLLGIVSFSVGISEFTHNSEEYAARQRLYRQTFEDYLVIDNQRDKFRDIFRRGGKTDAVPPPELSAIVMGVTDELPAAVNVTRNEQSTVLRSASRNPMRGLYHTPDFAYVVGVVLSLLAVLFVFDSISGEKETGTLRLMLSNGVGRHAILLSKWTGSLAVLAVPFLIVFVGGVALARARGSLVLEGDHAIRLLLLLLVALLYICVFVNIGIFVSCCTHRSTTSLFLCLLIWVGTVLVVPNIAPVLAKIMAPTPSVAEIEAEKDEVDEEIKLRIQRVERIAGDLMYGKRVERERAKLETEGEDRKKQWDRFLRDSTRRQEHLAGLMGRVSPMATWIYAATKLTSTGPGLGRRLERAGDRMFEKMKQVHDEVEEQFRASNWETVPDVHFEQMPVLAIQKASLNEVVNLTLNDLLILVILVVLFFMLSFIFFLRYDVR